MLEQEIERLLLHGLAPRLKQIYPDADFDFVNKVKAVSKDDDADIDADLINTCSWFTAARM